MGKHTAMTSQRETPKAGQVAYFVHLHLDTARDIGDHPVHQNERVYHVDGKARPMLVLAELKRERGRRWFKVLRITSKGLDAHGNPKIGHQLIGDCIGPEIGSFVVLELQRLPDNLLHAMNGRSAIVAPCHQFAFDQAWKIIQHKFLRHASEKEIAERSPTAPIPQDPKPA